MQACKPACLPCKSLTHSLVTSCVWLRLSLSQVRRAVHVCAYPSAEPPGDLLSLMARRVFSSRSTTMQRLCSEGLLSDLQAEDSKLHTPSMHTALPSPQTPAQPQPAITADGLPMLRPIRTRVGQPALPRSASQGESSGRAGGGSSMQEVPLSA